MIAALTELTSLASDGLLVAVFVFLRVGAAIALLPAFGETMIPARVRLALALAFTAVVAPSIGLSAAPTTLLSSVLAGFHEVLVGLILGLSIRVSVFVLQMAGTMAAQATSLSQLLGGQIIDPQPALGAVLVLGGIALATLFDLHVRVAEMFVISYRFLPFGTAPGAGYLAEWSFALADDAFRLAFSLAMPFLLGSLLYNLALGVINRAMPQMMVAFVGAPAITLGALVLLALAAPLMLTVWLDFVAERLQSPLTAGR